MSAAVHLFHGEDEFLVAKNARAKVDALVPADQRAFGLEGIQVPEDLTIELLAQCVSQCLQAVRTVGFLSASKVVWLEGLRIDTQGTRGGKVSEGVEALLQPLCTLIRGGLPPGQTLVISAPKTLTYEPLLSACKEKGQIVVCGEKMSPFDAQRKAQQGFETLLIERQVKMDTDVRERFLRKVGMDSRQIASELEKLLVYCHGSRHISTADVDAIVSDTAESQMWLLGDAVAGKSLEHALTLLRQLLFQKESAIGLVLHLQKRLRDLLLVREALDRNWLRDGRGSGGAEWVDPGGGEDTSLATEAHAALRALPPRKLGKRIREASGFSRGQLARCVELLAGTHRQLVSSSGLPDRLSFELLLFRMLS